MKIGLVLAGGGARGAYQIGVWKGLKEIGIDRYISVISGTSIGALNAVLFCQGDLNIAEEIWNDISIEKIIPTDHKDLLKRSILVTIGSKNLNFVKKYIPKAMEGGNISRSGLIDIIDNSINLKAIRENEVICYAACTEIPSIEAKYFKINNYDVSDIKKILLATSALPMIYGSENIDGKDYLDGGIVDNMPIQPVYGEGCDIIIVVPLAKEVIIDRKLYPNTKIIEIRPSEIEYGFDGTIDFNSDNAKKKMKIGYDDVINQIVPIIEIGNLIEVDNKIVKRRDKINRFKDSILKITKNK
ncbi:MAG: patatin-like phospholipase family protein [Clostridium sp.]|uniref:patatin-like phospholipase family protein n=1 Tax=Clostridium sp. TaxID=1506 RepID=UPI003F3D51AC